MNEQTVSQERERREELIGGLILLALGGLFLFQHLANFLSWGFPWPFFILGPGLGLFAALLVGRRRVFFLAVPAAVITTLGLILLYQQQFNYFQSWAYAWALLPTASGVGTMIMARLKGNQQLQRSGRIAAGSGLGMFLAFAVFFELLIFHSQRFSSFAWTLALLLVGAFLVVRGLLSWRTEPAPPMAPPSGDAAGRIFPY